MISVSEALDIIQTSRTDWGLETVPLIEAIGARTAVDVKARVTMPPFDASAMDGYAVRAEDTTGNSAELMLIAESAAGHGFNGAISKGKTVRIFIDVIV